MLTAVALAQLSAFVSPVPTTLAGPTQGVAPMLVINGPGGTLPDGADGLSLAFNLDDGPLSAGQDHVYVMDNNVFAANQSGPMLSVGGDLIGPAGPAISAGSWDSITIDGLSGSATTAGLETAQAGSGQATIHYEVTVDALVYAVDRTISYTWPDHYFTDVYSVTIPEGNVDIVKLYNGGLTSDTSVAGSWIADAPRRVTMTELDQDVMFGFREGTIEGTPSTFDGAYAAEALTPGGAEASIQSGADLGFVADAEPLDSPGVYMQWTLGTDPGQQFRVMEQFFAPTTDSAPEWTDTTLAQAAVGQAYSDGVAATAVPAATYLLDGQLPDGLSFDSATGAITGTPTATGLVSFDVVASNSLGSVRRTFELQVINLAWFDSMIMPEANAGDFYNDGVFAGGPGQPNVSYSIVSGALPGGLVLDPDNGTLRGVTTEAGSFSFTVQADNGVDQIQTELNLELYGNDLVPGWPLSNVPVFVLGENYDFTLVASGFPRPTLSLGAGSLPDGISFDANTGRLTGIPTTLGPVSFQVIASNGVGEDAVLDVSRPVSEARSCRDYSGESYVGSVLLNADGTPIGCGLTEAQGAPADLVPAGWGATFDERFGSGATDVFYRPRLGYACDDCWIGIDGEDSEVGLPIGFPINFYGLTFEDVFVNSNGSISFGAGSSEYDDPLDEILDGASGVVAVGVDLDNREIDDAGSLWGSGRHGDFFYWGRTTVDGHDAFVATWMNMQSFSADVDKFDWNTFQIVLVDIDDAAGTDVDIIINYGSLPNHDEGYDCEDLDPELAIDRRCRIATGLGTVVEGVATFASLQDDEGALYNGSWVADVADDGATPLNQAHLNNLVAGRFLFAMRGGLLDETATVPGPTGVPTATPEKLAAAVTADAPADLGGSPIVRYEVRVREVGTEEWSNTIFESSTLPITVADLVGGHEYEFQIAAVNGVGRGPWSDSAFAVALHGDPPVWTDNSLDQFAVGVEVNDGVTAEGFPAPTYELAESQLPDGLSLNGSTGAITGTPTTPGDYTFTIVARNVEASISHDFQVMVTEAPEWTDNTIVETAGLLLEYSDGVAASGFPIPTYSVFAGALPPGMSLDSSSGALTGSPFEAGEFTFTISASNGFGESELAEFTLVVAAGAPVWIDVVSDSFIVGFEYADTVAVIGDPTPTLAVTAGELPSGITFDPNTGALSGTPDTAGPVYFELTATNVLGDAVFVFDGVVRSIRGCRDYSGEDFVGSVLLNDDGTPIGCGTTSDAGAPEDLVPENWSTTFGGDFGVASGNDEIYTDRLGYSCDDCWIGIDGEDSEVGLPIGFPIDFYGTEFDSVFVNSNGSISFGSGSDEYDDPLDDILNGYPGVVAYGLDLDNREIDNAGSPWGSDRHGDFFYWGRTTVDGHDAFVATWMNMQSYRATVDKTDWNTFQIVLVDVDDDAGTDVDIIINYGSLQDNDEGYDCITVDESARCLVAIGLGTVSEGVTTYASLQDDDGVLYNGSFVADVADDGSTPLNQAHLNNLVAGRFLFEMRDGTLDETATVPGVMDTPLAAGGDAEVEILGSAPDDNGGSPITGYVIRWREVGEMNWQEMDVAEFPATVTGLTNGTEYEFQTAAVNGVGVADFSDSAVATPAGAPVWVDQELGAMQVGVTFTDGVFASGEPAPTYTVTAGTLPAGLSLNSTTGAITGTPTVAGSFSFTITASSGVGDPVSADFSGTVAAAAVTTTTMPPTTVPPTTTIPPVPEMGFVGIDPVRLLDTRESGMRFEAGTTHQLVVAGAHGVAADAAAVVLNLTATESLRRGFMTVYPCGQPRPLASNINFATGETIANAVTSAVGTDRSVCIYTSADTHVIVDIGGAYSVSTNGGRISALNPSRLYDSRDGGAAPLPARSVRRIVVAGRGGVAADASSVVLNVTIVDGSAEGFATVYPCGESIPLVSNVNFLAGDVVANSVTSAVGDGGAVCVFISQSAHLVVDATSMYGPTGNSGGLRYTDIVRVMDTRELTGPTSGAKVAAGRVQRVDIAGRHGLAADLSAVTISVAVDQPESAGFVTVFPCGGAVPLASNVNFGAGQTRAGAVTVQLGEGGALCIYTHSTTHLVVDVDAVFGISPT